MEKNIKDNPFNKLTKREKQVLGLILKGSSVKEICRVLNLKSNTISTYKKYIYLKTNTANIIELFQLANETKIINNE